MNRLVVYGVVAVGSALFQVGAKYLKQRERARRRDPAQWSTEEVAQLYVAKREENMAAEARRRAVAKAVEGLLPA